MDSEVARVLVAPEDTVGDIIGAMGSAGMGIALVVNEAGQLEGVVTDGDVRRALLRGADLQDGIKDIITPDPVVLSEGVGNGDAEVLQLLRSEGFRKRHPRLIPVIDGRGRPTRLVPVEALFQPDVAAQRRKPPSVARWLGQVLVIGGAGYIGSVLVRRLLAARYRVKVLDLMLYGDESLREVRGWSGFELVQGDTRHVETLVSTIQSASCVVHLAELVGDPLCARNPELTLQTNYLSTLAVARICSHLQINRFVYVSSCSVYGAAADPEMTLHEDSELAPLSLYAKTKINSERAILSMSAGSFSPCILRLGTVFGHSPRPRFDLVVNTLTAQAFFERKVRIFGGHQWRPLVHVSDVARAIQLALEAPIDQVGGQVLNIVGTNCRIADLGELIRDRFPDTDVDHADGVTDRRSYRVAGDKAAQVLGFRPGASVAEGIDEMAGQLEAGSIGNYKDERYYNVRALPSWLHSEPEHVRSSRHELAAVS